MTLKTIYNGSEFSWHKGAGSADASDIGFTPVSAFTVQSPKTGVIREFKARHHLTQQGEVFAWVYADSTDRVHITIYND